MFYEKGTMLYKNDTTPFEEFRRLRSILLVDLEDYEDGCLEHGNAEEPD